MAKNTEANSYPEKCCAHSRCINHSPNWKRTSKPRFQIDKGELDYFDRLWNYARSWFGAKPLVATHISWVNKCCSRDLAYAYLSAARICLHCGREEQEIIKYYAVCMCCGYKLNLGPGENWYISECKLLYVTNEEIQKIEEANNDPEN